MGEQDSPDKGTYGSETTGVLWLEVVKGEVASRLGARDDSGEAVGRSLMKQCAVYHHGDVFGRGSERRAYESFVDALELI